LTDFSVVIRVAATMVGRITVIATAMAVGTEAADLQPAEEATPALHARTARR
jgi:hypothetical protein